MADSNGGVAPTKLPGKGYRGLVMLLLFLVYAFNFLDRQIISILAIPIKDELGLSDEQLGLGSAESPSPCSIPRSACRSPGLPTG